VQCHIRQAVRISLAIALDAATLQDVLLCNYYGTVL
jgi:hypothetical protein